MAGSEVRNLATDDEVLELPWGRRESVTTRGGKVPRGTGPAKEGLSS
jgi:hypothetical protein